MLGDSLPSASSLIGTYVTACTHVAPSQLIAPCIAAGGGRQRMRSGSTLPASHAHSSARRYMKNSVTDPAKNEVMALLLGYSDDEAGRLQRSASALWVAEQMRARRAEYCRSVASSATVVTYNVALQPPTPEAVAALRPLLRPPPR